MIDDAPAPLSPEPAREPFWTWADAGLFAGLIPLALGIALILTKLLFLVFHPSSEALRALVPQFLGYAAWFAGLAALLRLRYDQPFWSSLAWRIPWPRLGLTLVAAPVLVLAVAFLGQALRMPSADNAIEKLLKDSFSIIIVGAFASTLGPLAEELAFRGFLQPLLIRSLGVAAGIVAASLPFALLHGPQYGWNWQHIALLVLASSVFGVTRWFTGSTAASTLVHALYNLLTFIGFLSQRKDLFS